MFDDRSETTSTVWAFLVGGAAGAALAMMFAPRPGRETREKLGEKIREGAEYGRELRQKMMRKGDQLKEDARRYAAEFTEAEPERRRQAGQAVAEETPSREYVGAAEEMSRT